MKLLFQRIRLLKNKIEISVSPTPGKGETHLFSNFSVTLFMIPFFLSCNLIKPSQLPSIYKSFFTTSKPVVIGSNFQIIGSLPENESTDNYQNTKVILSANKDISQEALTSSLITIQSPDNQIVTGSLSLAKRFITFKPTSDLSPNTKYNVTLNQSLKSADGESLNSSYQFSFTTSNVSITVAPAPTSANVSSSTTNNSSIAINFSAPINPETANNNITVSETSTSTPVSGTFNSSGNTVYFTPTTTLTSGSTYTITINPGVEDISGNTTTVAYTTNFTTGTTSTGTNSGTGTFLPTLSVNSINLIEGNSGVVNANFTITLSAPSTQAVTVDYATSDRTATSGTDYTAIPTTSLSFAAGETSKIITVVVSGDNLVEGNETFSMNISNASSNAIIGTPTGTATILNDDTIPSAINITSSLSNGTYTVGQVIPIQIVFSESVNVTGVPQLTLETGAIDAIANYISGTGTNTLTFQYTVVSGNTSNDLDYSSTTALSLNGGTIKDLPNVNDVVLTLPAPGTSGSLGSNKAIVINTTPSIAFDLTSSNGSETTTAVTIPVTISSSANASVNYSVTGGTASGSGTDFTLAAGTLNFTSGGATTQNINITVNNDTLFENDETIIITLASPTNAILGTNTVHTYTITNDDAAPTIAFAAASSNSTDETATSRTIAINLSAASGQAISVVITDLGTGSATSGIDYTAIGSPLTVNFAIGDTTKNVTIPVLSDTTDENDETINLSLSSPTNATLGGQSTHTFSIIDDDAAPSLSIDSPSVTEGDSGSKNLTYIVTLSAASGKTVTVDYATSNGTATTADSDYTAITTTTLTFTPGETSKTVDVVIYGDAKNEINETVVVTLATPVNATITTGTGTGTMTNDDTAPTVAFTATTSNGGEAITPVTIPVTLTGNATAQTVTVGYSVTGGTATGSGTDFTLASGTLTFNPDTTSQNISITLNNDALNESNETIVVTLASPTVATLGTNTAHTFTIIDDDTPLIAFNATSSNGSEATTSVTIPVTISLTATASVNYSVTGGTATSEGTDFTLASGTLNFTNGGTTSQDITITINNDALNEANETIEITLSSPTNANLGTNTIHTYTINDNDAAPTVAFTATTSNGSEATTSVTIPVTLSTASGQTVTVGYSVTGGTAAGSGTDFTLGSGTLTFTAGVTSQNISVTVVNDSTTELNETIQITLASPTNSTLGTNTVHTYTINDNDPPTVAFTATTSNGSEATTSVTIPVTLSAASGQTVTVGYSVTGGSAAGSGTDFTLDSGTLTFTAGVTSQNISVTVVNDSTTELNETIQITLASPTNATLGTNTAHTYTINDNDPAGVTIVESGGSTNVTEGGATDTYTIVLNSQPTANVTIAFGVGTQVNGLSDITFTNANWNSAQTITVTPANDAIFEGAHTQVITHSSTSGDTNYNGLSITSVTANITDNDSQPTVAFGGATSNSTDETATSRTIPINLSNASNQAISVVVTDAGGTATSGTDYTAIGSPLTVNFAAGETTKNVTVPVLSDTLDETNETIVLTLSGPTNSTLGGQTTHTFTIVDDDAAPSAFLTGGTTNSIGEGAGNYVFSVSISAMSGVDTAITVNTAAGTATAGGTDFATLTNATITIPAGQTSGTINIAITDDTTYDGNETFGIFISGPTITGGAVQTVTIIDNEVGITSATTLDTDGNGKIDAYKIVFTEAVNDNSFPGYAVNANGSTQSTWLIAGYTDLVLSSGTAAASAATAAGDGSDSANDAVIYLRFTEGASGDTGAKPDLTTTASPGLTAVSGNTLPQVGTLVANGGVTEQDGAKAVIMSAVGMEGTNSLTVTFSEAVYTTTGAPACTGGTDITVADTTFTNGNASGAGSVTSLTEDCGADNVITYTTNNNLIAGDAADTIAYAAATVYDAANYEISTTAKTLTVTASTVPALVTLEELDTDYDGKIDTVQLTFDKNMSDATISANLSQMTVGGLAVTAFNTGATVNDAVVRLSVSTSVATGTDFKQAIYTAGSWQSILGGNAASFTYSAHNGSGVPRDVAAPVIISAVAADVAPAVAGVDSGDTLTITFSETVSNFGAITNGNITSLLSLSGGQTWPPVGTAVWSNSNKTVTITFSGTGTITDNTVITAVNTTDKFVDAANNFYASSTTMTGSFTTDTTPPYLVYATDTTTNSLIVQFSEPMRMSSGTASQNADNISNYILTEDPVNACTDVTFGSLTVLSTSSVKLTTGGQTFCNIQYKLTTAATVTDLAGNTIGSPNYLTFTGLEAIKVLSATAVTSNTMRITFSKPLLTGNNVTNSAECNTTGECALRYKITPQIGDGTITSAVVGAGENNHTVTLTHNGTQGGNAYTVITANAADSDGFNNGSFCIKDSSDVNCVQASPKDRMTFVGSGTTCNTLSCGSFFDDPFFDGTTFSYVFKYDNKIYLGTNDKNNGVYRFDPLGTNSILTTFKFTNNSSLALSCAAATGFGYITSDLLTQTCGTNGGANGEVGVVGFTSMNFVVNSVSYEMLGIGSLKNAVDTAYYTQDKDSTLDLKSFALTDGNGTNTKSFQVMYGIDDKLFTTVASDHGTNSPVLNRALVTQSSGVLTVGTPVDISGLFAPYLGKQGSPGNAAAAVVGIDFIERVGSSTYLANNGGVIYIPTSNLLTGAKPNTTGQFASNFGPVLSTPSHVNFTGTSLQLPISNSTTGGGLGKIRPGEKAYPYLLSYNSKLYLARNVGTVPDSKVNLRGEVWTCTPNGSGQCAPASWSRIISGTESDLNPDNKAISMFISNGTNLYVGFDGATNGVKVFRYSGISPSSTSGSMVSAGWLQQGADGLGSSSKYIFNSTSILDQISNKNYIYIMIGNGLGSGSAIKVVRQAD